MKSRSENHLKSKSPDGLSKARGAFTKRVCIVYGIMIAIAVVGIGIELFFMQHPHNDYEGGEGIGSTNVGNGHGTDHVAIHPDGRQSPRNELFANQTIFPYGFGRWIGGMPPDGYV